MANSGGHQPVWRCQPLFSLKMLQSQCEKNMMFVCIISIMMTNFVVLQSKLNVSESFKVLAGLGGLDPVARKNLRGPFLIYIKRFINKQLFKVIKIIVWYFTCFLLVLYEETFFRQIQAFLYVTKMNLLGLYNDIFYQILILQALNYKY